jgi:hypothetical protein
VSWLGNCMIRSQNLILTEKACPQPEILGQLLVWGNELAIGERWDAHEVERRISGNTAPSRKRFCKAVMLLEVYILTVNPHPFAADEPQKETNLLFKTTVAIAHVSHRRVCLKSNECIRTLARRILVERHKLQRPACYPMLRGHK